MIESIAGDIAALVGHLGLENPDGLGYSVGAAWRCSPPRSAS